MIKINLLPQELAGGKGGDFSSSAGGGSALVVTVLVVLFGLNIGLGLYFFSAKKSADSALAQVRAEAKSIEDELKQTEVEYNDTRVTMERMRQLIDVADSLAPRDRMIWSRKLNMLPMVVPEGVYLTQIEVTQRVTEKESADSIKARNDWMKTKKGPAPATEKFPVYSQTLVLQGIAYVPDGTPAQRLDQIVLFNRRLRDGRYKVPFDKEPMSFMEGFRPDILPSPVSPGRMSGRDVSLFRFTLNTRPLEVTGRPPAAPAAPAAATPTRRN